MESTFEHPGPAPRTVSLVPYQFDETRAWAPFPDDWESRLFGAAGPVAQSGAYQVTFVPVEGAAEGAAGGAVVALVDPGPARCRRPDWPARCPAYGW